MAPILYMKPFSQPSRAALMTIKALNIEINLKEVDLVERQQFSSDYLKINPQHTIPTLIEEDGFILWESHAIMPYLVGKYGKDDSLYPKDLRKRAIVDQRLHFESGVLFPRTMDLIRPIIYEGEKSVSEDKIQKLKEAYGFLETFLEGNEWIAGNSLTIADFSTISSITTMNLIAPIDPEVFPNLVSWIKRMQKLPYYEQNVPGLEEMRRILEERLN